MLQGMGLHDEAELLAERAQRARAGGRLEQAKLSGPLVRSERVRTAGGIVDRLAAICDQADEAELVLAETLELLRDLGVGEQWSVVRRGPGDDHGLFREGKVMVPLVGQPGSGVLVESRSGACDKQTLARVVRVLERLDASVGSSRPAVSAHQPTAATDVMRPVLELARRAARSDVPVLILGETGVGKEWLARQIHQWSKRSRGRFLGFNCSAVPREMLDAQLFGHRKGAFTGAHESSIGVIRAAAGGTLLLDEIGEVPPELQVKLLRFLEGREVHPIGESVPVSVDVRVLAATNVDPDDLIERGVLRKDLYYRINVVTIRIPPLRDRGDEIIMLAESFLREVCEQVGKARLKLSKTVRDLFREYSWPGNVRQLLNEVRRAVALTDDGEEIGVEVLSEPLQQAANRSKTRAGVNGPTVTIPLDQKLGRAVATLEYAAIRRALEVTGGRRDAAAMLLGLSRKGLYLKCRRMGMGGDLEGP